MAICAHIRIYVEIIQQDKIARQLMVVRGHILPKQDQRCVAITFLHVPQNLIVSPVLFHNVQHVLNGATRTNRAPRRSPRIIQLLVPIR